MAIETMTKQESSSVKGGRWVYLQDKWYWVKDAR